MHGESCGWCYSCCSALPLRGPGCRPLSPRTRVGTENRSSAHSSRNKAIIINKTIKHKSSHTKQTIYISNVKKLYNNFETLTYIKPNKKKNAVEKSFELAFFCNMVYGNAIQYTAGP